MRFAWDRCVDLQLDRTDSYPFVAQHLRLDRMRIVEPPRHPLSREIELGSAQSPRPLDAEAEVLDLRVVEDPVLGALAAAARFLDAAERRHFS